MPSDVGDTPRTVPIGAAARHIGVSVDTLRRWDREGRITSVRTVGNQRRYNLTDLDGLTATAKRTEKAGAA